MMKRAVFLDRDGTINVDHGYISKPEDFELYPQTIEALKILKKMNYLLIVVTNQSGIARGYYTESDLDKIHTKMIDELKSHNITLTDIFYSPYHENGVVKPFIKKHKDRKPELGLFKKALYKYEFKIKESFMIGDKYTDVLFGKKAGLTTILLLTGEGEKEFYERRRNWHIKPDFIAKNILSAAKLIEKLTETEKK